MANEKVCPQCGTRYEADHMFCFLDGAALIQAQNSTDLVGSIIADRYRVVSKIGDGGMGQVYLAEHVRMKRRCAVKIMRPQLMSDPVAIVRFNREAENASQISHPNVCAVYDFGETPSGLIYLAMEFIDGDPLSKILEQEVSLAPVRAADVITQTADALSAAHGLGILHRDLKPDNIMLAKSRAGTDHVKIVDFGIARVMSIDYRFPAEGLERAGSVLGSGTLFKALDEALTGRKGDDSFEAEIAFPGDFRNEQLAGKSAKVTFKIIKVQEPKLPEIDGEFAKLFGIDDGDMETFRKEVRANLERELKAALMARLKSEVAEKLAEAHAELNVPNLMVQSEARNMATGSVPQGQQPPPQLIEAAMPIARKRVVAGLLMGELARKQGIKIDRKRVAEQLAAIASTYEEPEKVIELYNGDPQLMSGLQNRVMEDQVAEWVAEHARTTQQDLSFDDVMRPANA